MKISCSCRCVSVEELPTTRVSASCVFYLFFLCRGLFSSCISAFFLFASLTGTPSCNDIFVVHCEAPTLNSVFCCNKLYCVMIFEMRLKVVMRSAMRVNGMFFVAHQRTQIGHIAYDWNQQRPISGCRTPPPNAYSKLQ